MSEIRTAYSLSDWQGYMTHAEIDLLKEFAQLAEKNAQHRTPIFVNIGAGAGTSTFSLLEAVPSSTIFTVDILASGSEATTNEYLRLKEMGLDKTGQVIKVWGDSKVVGLRWPIIVDLVFVDGDHSYDGCAEDIKAWLPHLRSGGVMAFHDYGSNNWPDVIPAVHDLMGGKPDKVVDTLAVYQFGKKK